MDTESRVCKRCSNDLELKAFRAGRYTCRTCEVQRIRDRDAGQEGWFRRILKSSKDNAKNRGIHHELTLDDIRDVYEEQSGKCAVTRLPLTTEVASHDNPRWTNASLDRVSVDVGYTRENVIMACWCVNRMRHRMSYGDLRFWCELILHGDDPSQKDAK